MAGQAARRWTHSGTKGPNFAAVNRKVEWIRPSLLRPSPSAVVILGRGLADYPDHVKVTLPALSPTMEVGTIVSWSKNEGDKLNEGDLLCEIETDKATMGFDVPEEGYLAKITLPAGSKDVPIGKLLCVIVESQEDVAKFKDFVDEGGVDSGEAKAESAPAPAPPPPPAAPATAAATAPPPMAAPPPTKTTPPLPSLAPSGKRPFASPAAKKLAQEKGVDLSQIANGSGMDGIITSKDVENFAKASPSPLAARAPAGLAVPMGAAYSDAELSNMRKTIAKRLQASKLEIPHYYLTVECEMDSLLNLRSEINKQYEKEGIKLSVNDFIIKATALACKRVPECNSAWMDTAIREFHTCDVSVAVDTGSGLITPIVASAETKGLMEISETIRELAGRAREGKLQPHEFMGGSITVSNLGMFGIEHFTAIINPPQSCILAVGGTSKKAVPTKDGFAIKSVMKVTLSCDHRVVDGAVGAQWLKHFKKFLEQPSSMLL